MGNRTVREYDSRYLHQARADVIASMPARARPSQPVQTTYTAIHVRQRPSTAMRRTAARPGNTGTTGRLLVPTGPPPYPANQGVHRWLPLGEHPVPELLFSSTWKRSARTRGGHVVPVLCWILIAFIWIGIAFWPARVADRKGHSFIGYFIFSLFFFPAATITAYLIHDRTHVPPRPATVS